MKSKWIKKSCSVLLVLCLVLGALVFSPLRQTALAADGDTVTFTVAYENGWYRLINVYVPTGLWGSLSIIWPEVLRAKRDDSLLNSGGPGTFPATSPADTTTKPAATGTNWNVQVANGNISVIMTGYNNYPAQTQIRDYLQQLRFYLLPGESLPSAAGFRVSIRAERIASFTQDGYEHYYEYFRFWPGTVGGKTYPVDPLNPGTSGDKSKMW
ncbi:MAG: hypothetical protein LBB75_09660, partial [Oscillospiraceae bacterium]|nr:hypothetical protein [Oscillospiraceae bacterium]